MELDVDIIITEMKRIKVNKTWLANKLNVTPAMVSYVFKNKPISFAVKMSEIFNINPKYFLKE